jgi:hypothetical protein
VIKVPKRPKYRDPRYDRISRQWDKVYGGKDSGVLSPAQVANKVKVRSWIDEQNNLKRKPVDGIHQKREKK